MLSIHHFKILCLNPPPGILSDTDNTVCVKTMQTTSFILGIRLGPVQDRMVGVVLKIKGMQN